jgi:hypothetical protein
MLPQPSRPKFWAKIARSTALTTPSSFKSPSNLSGGVGVLVPVGVLVAVGVSVGVLVVVWVGVGVLVPSVPVGVLVVVGVEVGVLVPSVPVRVLVPVGMLVAVGGSVLVAVNMSGVCASGREAARTLGCAWAGSVARTRTTTNATPPSSSPMAVATRAARPVRVGVPSMCLWTPFSLSVVEGTASATLSVLARAYSSAVSLALRVCDASVPHCL